MKTEVTTHFLSMFLIYNVMSTGVAFTGSPHDRLQQKASINDNNFKEDFLQLSTRKTNSKRAKETSCL